MAEAQFDEVVGEEELASAPQVDSDVLPDDVERELTGIQLYDQLEDGNLVDQLDDIPIGTAGVSALTIQLYDEAKQSMKKWLDAYTEALKLAKLEAETAKKTFPFEDASIVMMPFIMETMLDFHSRTVPELVWAKNVVGIKTYGTQTDDKVKRAKRVSDYMNFQISETIPFWRREQDKLLLTLPCVGTGYKITYFNADEQEVRSDLYQGNEVVFDHAYKTFEEAPDKFIEEEFTRNEVITRIRGDQAWKLDESVLPLQKDHPKPFKFLRAWTWIDLDDDGYTEPYEVVIYREDDKVVSVYPAYDEEEITENEDGEIVDVKMCEIFTQYRFLPDPEGGPMGMGWGILLADMFDAVNTNMRQMIDAGTLANLAGNSGLIDAKLSGQGARGNRQQSGPIEVRMGELTPITTGGAQSLGQSVVQFPYQGPNQALFDLLKYMVEQIRNMANSAINMDVNAQEAAMMYLARLQQGLKVPNSIVMRVYNCAQEEFKKIAALNFKHYSDKRYNAVIDDPEEASMRADFNPEDCDVRLAVDPSQGSDVERQQRSQMVLEEAKTQTQQVINVRQAYLNWGEALGVPDLDRLMPEPSGEKDPMEVLMLQNMAREAELAEREMNIREQRLTLDQTKETLRAMKEGAEVGLQFDKNEADIAFIYAQTFHKLWEMGMAGEDPIATVRDIEGQLIDKRIDLPAPPQPLPSPQPQSQEVAAPQ